MNFFKILPLNSRYFNINRIFTTGTEINFIVRPTAKLTISAGYQYLIAKDASVIERIRNGQIFARNPETLATIRLQNQDYFGLFNRSRHLANLKVSYQIPKWKANIFARVFYRSRYGLFDSNANGIFDDYDSFVKGYCLFNVAISKEFQQKLLCQIGANNLFNFTDAENISNLAGRQLFFKMQFSF
ncbi:TonB-dependent receptor domain-containing protein [Raineya orbicola]|uniref:TonB dependent receptor n=1 Tax=Raineya orbicola TaxID=2016530 RepID=A0A2N3HY11_9BACT|nr:TonB-dependent receptor [Raineya orbicola]PKQ62955.1 TonB dependent receptor [Raineya orbicola]